MDNFIQADIYTASQAIDGITGALTDYGITGFIISDSADFESFLADKKLKLGLRRRRADGAEQGRAAHHAVRP